MSTETTSHEAKLLVRIPSSPSCVNMSKKMITIRVCNYRCYYHPFARFLGLICSALALHYCLFIIFIIIHT
jgi:hypothetical protein